MSTPPPSAPATDLDAAILRAAATARAAWPGVEVDPALFAGCIRERSATDSLPLAAIERLATGDLYLCCAVVSGDARAMVAFDQLLGIADAALARIGGDASFADEVRQRVRIKLLVVNVEEVTSEVRLGSYRGEGTLASFLRVLLVREGLDMRRQGARRETRTVQAGREAMTIGTRVDPEVAHLRARYGPEFERAFADAIQALAPPERTLLRYHYVDRLNIDQIGALENIHRVSAARRLTRLRQALVEETRRLVRERLRLDETELGSVLRMLESDLHLSVRRLLA